MTSRAELLHHNLNGDCDLPQVELRRVETASVHHYG